MTITTFTLPQELSTVAECDEYIKKCEARRDSYAKLQGAPRKRAVAKAWEERIFLAKVRKAELK